MSANPIPIDEDPSVCIGCGYRLRGLNPRGNCPECGLAVARSLYGGDAWADRQWLRGLRAGTGFLLAALALAVARAVMAWVIVPPTIELLASLFLPLSLLCCAGAAWALATRVPWAGFLDTTAWHRRVMRGLACACAAIAPVCAISTLARLGWIVPIGAAAIGLLSAAATLSFLAEVAHRLLEEGLAKAIHTTLGLGTVAVLLPVLVFGVFDGAKTAAALLTVVVAPIAGGVATLLLIAVLVEFQILIRETEVE